MSEEKIINIIENFLNYKIEKYLSGIEVCAISRLLDLYYKEKEKNKELYEIKYIASRFINRSMKQFSIGEFKYKVNNSISKDKIRKFIEEETHKGTYEFKSISAKRLQELLEEVE